MNQVSDWAVIQMKKLMVQGMLEDEDLRQMISNFVQLDPESINEQVSSLLDFSKKEVKAFIKEFVERVEA